MYPYYRPDQYGPMNNGQSFGFPRGGPGGFPGNAPGGFPGNVPGVFPIGGPGNVPGGFPGGGVFPIGGPGNVPGGFLGGGGFPGGGPGAQGGGQGAMQLPGPPPQITPQKPQRPTGLSTYAVDPGAVIYCLYKYVYIWPTFGLPFWAWLYFVGPNSIAGWRWSGFNWVYFALDLRYIEYFRCY